MAKILKSGSQFLGSGNKAFSVADLTSLKMWLKADALTLNDGDAVATWTDSSTNTRNATQSDNARKPTFKAAILNGKPVVRFVDDYVTTATTPALGQPNTVFAVVQNSNIPPATTYTAVDSTNDHLQLLDLTASGYRVYSNDGFASTAASSNQFWQIVDAQFNNASSNVYVDGVYYAAGSVAGTTGFAGIRIGARGGATPQYWVGDIAEVIVCNAALDVTTRAKVTANLVDKYRTLSGRLIFDGDSLTFGVGSTDGHTYPAQCTALLPGKTEINIAIAGQRTTQIQANTNAAPYGGYLTDDIYVLWICTNDLLADFPLATVESNLTAILTARRTARLRTILCTLPDCKYPSRPVSYDANRPTLNTWIRNNAGTLHYTVCDLAADSRIGPDGTANDATYFADAVHMTNTGYGVVASLVAATIGTLGY